MTTVSAVAGGRWPVMFGDVRVVDRVAAGDVRDVHESLTLPRLGFDGSMMIPSLPRLGFDGSMMKRHDDSQRGDRLAVTFGDPHESLTARRAYASVPGLRFRRMVMTRHDDSQRIDGLAVTQRGQRGGSRLTRIRAGLYTRPRMGTDSIQPSRRLAVTQRGGSRLTRIRAGFYTRPRMGTDTIQPSYRLPLAAQQPTSRRRC